MKVSDFTADFLAQHGMTDIFLVSGGGIAHLLDSIGRHPAMRYYCNYHEQACAVAAEGHARVTGRIAACLVTWGPGAVNGLSGILAAWVDSIPLLVLSGQVRSDLIADKNRIRQFGPQEGNVIDMAKPVTKYCVSVREPSRIRYELEKAVYLATSGRPGPVWVELPFDVQAAEIGEGGLESYRPEPAAADGAMVLARQVGEIAREIKASKRPIIIAGNGIQLAGGRALFQGFLERWRIPVVLPFSAKDLLPDDHPLNMGVFGTCGQRRANFAVQSADLVLALGAGLSVAKTGFNFKGFAPRARKIIVDIDPGQASDQAVKADLPIVADAREFMQALIDQGGGGAPVRWLQACATWRQRYPNLAPDAATGCDFADMYVFMDRFSDALPDGAVMVTGNGSDVVSCWQAFKVKPGQRVINSGNWGAMGWDMPLAIGAGVAAGNRPVVLVTGDGSIQWNIQEFLTAQYYRLPLKIFVFNNNGYTSIRATQNSLFAGFLVGADPRSGVGGVDFRKLADLYGFTYFRISHNEGIREGVEATLAHEGAALCEVMISPDQPVAPKASAFRRPDGTMESRPLEDMAPFLPREEVWHNMHQFDEEGR